MTTISDKDRAELQAMYEAFHGCSLSPLGVKGVSRWLAVRDQVLASHTCEPEWRPTTAKEIQLGWEIRSRRSDGSPMAWGIAHRLTPGGNWRNEMGAPLTNESWGWTYETTAPLPAQDPRIAVVMEWYGSTTADHDGIADLLTRLDNLKAVEYSESNSN